MLEGGEEKALQSPFSWKKSTAVPRGESTAIPSRRKYMQCPPRRRALTNSGESTAIKENNTLVKYPGPSPRRNRCNALSRKFCNPQRKHHNPQRNHHNPQRNHHNPQRKHHNQSPEKAPQSPEKAPQSPEKAPQSPEKAPRSQENAPHNHILPQPKNGTRVLKIYKSNTMKLYQFKITANLYNRIISTLLTTIY